MPKTTSHPPLAGAALSIGAGLGATIGVLVVGAPGVAIGAGVGAATGLVAGAAWDAFHLRH